MISTRVRALLAAVAVVATLLVTTGTAVAAPFSIQAAIDAAPNGGTVVIPAGTYREEIVIGKDVTVVGAGVDRTIIQAPAHMTSYGTHLTDGRGLLAIVRVWKGAHVQMSGFTVRGPIPCDIEVTGIHTLLGATLDLSNARVTGIQADPATCAPDQAAGRAIVFGTPPHIRVNGKNGSNAFGSVNRVTVDHFQHAGISVANATKGKLSQVSVNRSTITGGWTIPTFQLDMDLEGRVVVDVIGNAINDATCGGSFCGPDPIFDAEGVGVLLFGVPHGSRVMGNTFTRDEEALNVIFSPNCCVVSGNTFTDSRWFAIAIQDGNGTTQGNRIFGGGTGIAAVADAADTTVVSQGDRIFGAATPYREIECCGFDATVVVQ